jgi:hypothetical protein
VVLVEEELLTLPEFIYGFQWSSCGNSKFGEVNQFDCTYDWDIFGTYMKEGRFEV